MTEFNELANSPMEIELMGKVYKVRRVPMDTIFGKAETAVISKLCQRITQMAETIEDLDERASYRAKAGAEIPIGEKLNQLTTSFLKSVDGVKMVLVDALRKDHPAIEKEVDMSELISSEPEKIKTIMMFCTGRLGKKDGPFVEAGRSPHPESQPSQNQ